MLSGYILTPQGALKVIDVKEDRLSINEYLYVVPKLLKGIANVVLRWRVHHFVFAIDIKIVITPEDRQFRQIN